MESEQELLSVLVSVTLTHIAARWHQVSSVLVSVPLLVYTVMLQREPVRNGHFHECDNK